MIQLRIIALTVITAAFFSPNTLAQFYYSNGQQFALKVDSSKMCIKFNPQVGQDDQPTILASISRLISLLEDNNSVDGFLVCSLAVDDGYGSFLDSVEQIGGVRFVEPYYLTLFDSAFLVGDRFCAAFEVSTSQSAIDSINASLGTVIQYEMPGMSKVFILYNTPASGYRTLELANLYYELPHTRYAHPIFGARVEQHGYKVFDHFNAYQPHIKKVIGQFNAASVWDFAGLTQVKTVAVLDDGVSDDGAGGGANEDLPGSRVLPGANFVNNVIGPNTTYPSEQDYHGMACAGIIAATHTNDSLFGLDSNSGVISLAPYSEILPIKIFDFDKVASFDSLALAITFAWQNEADVLTNSWGFGSLTCSQAAIIYNYLLDVITEAINNAFTFGRGGKGCPVIFSAGNAGADFAGYPSCLSSAFAVGAIDLNDSLWYYSQYGDSLDLVAPSADIAGHGDFFSTDQSGKNGVNYPGPNFNCQPGLPEDGDYICNFGGTSAACPIVAGVAALILSKDSTLMAQEVYDILRYSAVTKLASDTIMPPDEQYGYGRVDAFRAILSISRGDLNNDGAIGKVLDLNFLVNRIFRNGPYPFPSPLMGDCDCNGVANNPIDLNYLVNHIFRSGPPPVNPCFKF